MAAEISTENVMDYNVVLKKLDEARNGLNVEAGSSIYSFDQSNLSKLPQSEFTPLNEVMLRAPGVVQDSYGQLHVRGDHADLQYRINDVIIPEGISGFGQTLDTHFADKIDFLTGALPAEYGYRTAGIINIKTKTGTVANGGRSSVMMGSNDTLEGNQEFYGSSGPFSYYLTGNYAQNDRGIEPPTSGKHPLHDDTQQDKEFGYFSYVLSPDKRLSFIFGNATNRFEIPNNPGQAQLYTQTGVPNADSANLYEQQFERNTYGIVALQGVINDNTDYQFALFSRDSSVLFKPDDVGDLQFNGIASRAVRSSFTNGLQNDYSYHYDDAHTIRTGLSASYEKAHSGSDSLVYQQADCDISGNCANPPTSIYENSNKGAVLSGLYLQDEWKALDKLTVNYGARYDYYDAYVTASQLSPRLGAIYDLTADTKLHAGYAHYFTPPPTELIAPVAISDFTGTTGELNSSVSSPVRPETSNYFDVGVIQKIESLTLGIDGYYKRAHNLLDEGQFGSALIYAPFNYDKGYVKGIEFTADYNNSGPFSAYANISISQAEGKGVASGEFNFDSTELAYINSNYVHLDHDQSLTGSAGISYNLHDIIYSADVLYGSGLRNDFANTGHLSDYTQVNLGAAHNFDLGNAGKVDAKLSVINVFDEVYQIRDGSGIGVFAPQYGPRRGFYLSLSRPF